VLGALARALRLSEAERGHLFRLAGQAPPTSGRISTHLTPGVQRLLDQLEGTPVGVFDAAWNLIAWNRLWAALQGDPSVLSARDRNVLLRHFIGRHEPGAAPGRVTHTAEQEARFEASAVADLRAMTARYPADPKLRALVAELRAASARFVELWQARSVGEYTSDVKTVHHPEAGAIALDCDMLTVVGSDVRLVAYTAAPGSESAEKLRLLAVIGTQEMTTGTP
jgi:hypothetical protein